jgi:hypothetical protein
MRLSHCISTSWNLPGTPRALPELSWNPPGTLPEPLQESSQDDSSSLLFSSLLFSSLLFSSLLFSSLLFSSLLFSSLSFQPIQPLQAFKLVLGRLWSITGILILMTMAPWMSLPSSAISGMASSPVCTGALHKYQIPNIKYKYQKTIPNTNTQCQYRAPLPGT